ncbi:MAG: hypothetical protein AAB728_01945 [Patescibacteria group bacterium]
MPKPESVFWGAVVVAGLYLLSGWDVAPAGKTNARLATSQVAAAQGRQNTPRTGGHTMPDGSWMADGAMGGMGCGMHGGGGCGCGH